MFARKIRRHCGGWQTSHEKSLDCREIWSPPSQQGVDDQAGNKATSSFEGRRYALWESWRLVEVGRCRDNLCAISVTVAHLFCLFPMTPKLMLITFSFSCQKHPRQWVMQHPEACPVPCETERRGMISDKNVWIMEKSTRNFICSLRCQTSTGNTNTAQSHLSLWNLNHFLRCSCNSREVNNQKEQIQAQQSTASHVFEQHYQLGLCPGGRISLGKAKKIVMPGQNIAFFCWHFSLRKRRLEEKLSSEY